MEHVEKFDILISRKIPYLSRFLMGLMMVFFLCAGLLFIFTAPTAYASDEMKTAYFLLLVPDWVAIIGSLGGLGLLITIPLYYAARIKKKGTIVFDGDHIKIQSPGIDVSIKKKLIDKIFVNELTPSVFKRKQRLQIVIHPRYASQIHFFLLNFANGDDFVALVSRLDNVQFSFYNSRVLFREIVE